MEVEKGVEGEEMSISKEAIGRLIDDIEFMSPHDNIRVDKVNKVILLLGGKRMFEVGQDQTTALLYIQLLLMRSLLDIKG